MRYYLRVTDDEGRILESYKVSLDTANAILGAKLDPYTLFNKQGLIMFNNLYRVSTDCLDLLVEMSTRDIPLQSFETQMTEYQDDIIIVHTDKGSIYAMRKHFDDDEEISLPFINRHMSSLIAHSYEITKDFDDVKGLTYWHDLDKY